MYIRIYAGNVVRILKSTLEGPNSATSVIGLPAQKAKEIRSLVQLRKIRL